VLNQASPLDQSELNEMPDWETSDDLMRPPDLIEVHRTINQLKSGKAAGADGLPPVLFRIGCPDLTYNLVMLFCDICQKRTVPQGPDFQNFLRRS